MPLKGKWSRVPVGLLPELRKVVKRKEKEFVKGKEKRKLLNNKQLFRVLDTRAAAYTPPLLHQFLAASAAYSCATPDNRIRIEVDQLQIIQGKDARLRERESRATKMAKKGGGDGPPSSIIANDIKKLNAIKTALNDMSKHGQPIPAVVREAMGVIEQAQESSEEVQPKALHRIPSSVQE